MRVDTAVLSRFRLRAPLLAALACATLALSGCSVFRSEGRPAFQVSNAPDAAPSSGAQTSNVSQLKKFLWVFSPYRPDIQQGNFVSQEMFAQLKEGQTREQVQFILGTALLTDPFHADRWDYPFYLQRGNGELTTARVSVYFKDNKVARIDGGNLPTEKEYIARIAGPAKVNEKTAPKKEEAGSASIQINK